MKLKTLFSLKEDVVILPIDKAANNVAFIWKHFYTLNYYKRTKSCLSFIKSG